MPNPIDIEQAYQQAVNDIETALSYRFIFARFFEFVKLLEGDHLKYQSYLIQLMDMLPVFTLPIMWSGLDPENLAGYADSIEEISEKIHREPPARVVQRLRQAAFLQYICLSEPALAVSELRKISGIGKISEPENINPGESNKNLLSIKEWLKESISDKERSAKEEEPFQQLIHDIHILTREREFATTIPVVEHNLHGDDREAYPTGRLRNLALHESGAAENEDQIIRYFPVAGAEPVSEMNKKPVSAVPRRMAEAKYPVLKGQFYRAHLHYEINGANHDGQSSDVAVSALWFTYLTEKAETREHIRLTGQAAITGTLNEDGVIDGVDEDGIKWKVRAAFFSWIDYLVVPMSQYSQFEQELKKVQKNYPSKKCTLIGVNSVEEIFYDRRLTRYHYESRLKHSLKKLKREKFKVVGIPVIVILLLVIARLMYGPIDRNPVTLTFVDNFIEIKNSDGYVLNRLQQIGDSNVGTYISGQAELLDVNNDLYNDVIYDFTNEDLNNGNPVLRAWSAIGDSVLWETEINLSYSYPRQLIPDFTNLRVINIDIGHSSDGPRVVVNARSTQYFQGVLLIYDAKSGVLLSEYAHSGIIRDMLVMDRDNNGISEVILAGVNNAYWKAFVAELDVENGDGYSPSTPDYIPEGIHSANEKIYFLLPKSSVAEYLTPVEKYNTTREIRFDSKKSEFLAIVAEGLRYFHEVDYTVDLLFHLSSSFQPTGIGSSDMYDVAARDFYREGKIPFEPDYDYFEALQDSILYWTGEEFVPTQEYFSGERE
jgi:hypothetical protein